MAATPYSSFQVPVVLEIHFNSSSGLFQLTRGFTAFPGEDEFLVQDGLEYLVVDNREVID